MDLETIKLLATYNRTTNQQMNTVLSSLTDEEWMRPLVGYYPSVHSVCNHLWIADFNWLKRFENLREFDYRKAPLFDQSPTFASTMFETRAQYLALRTELDEHLIRLSDEVTPFDFEQILRWTNFRGEAQARNFGGILLHVFNHQTHHRGMISLYLEQLGKPNDFSNLMYLV